MKSTLKMVGLGFFIFLCFFFTGWASCMIMVEVKQHLPITNHLILGILVLFGEL